MIEKEMENLLDDVHETHYSSYQDLPPHLQRCFAFCSLFPKKWRFEREKLVKMWAALGFIEDVSETHGGTMVKKMAMGYFDALLERSLFRKVDSVEGESGQDHRYVIHEHIHSMLRRKACPKYFLSIDGSRHHLNPTDRSQARHVSVTTDCLDQLMDEGFNAKKLRTLLIFHSSDAATTWTSTSPPLMTSTAEFDASNRKKGHSMRELGELNSLSGTLGIKGLETVGSKKEAKSAHLERKGGPEWGHRSEHKAKSCSDSDVLEGLQPHPNLQELHITRYQGEEPPRWLADARTLQKMRSCRKLVALPAVGGLPCLQVLEVKELCSVERIDGAFCGSGAFESLEKMVLHDMPALLAWDAVEPCSGR